MSSSHTYGGEWTTEKLERVRKNLQAYTRIIKNNSYKAAYIDALLVQKNNVLPSFEPSLLVIVNKLFQRNMTSNELYEVT